MANVNDEVVIEDADVQEDDFTPEELADDKTDWKAKAEELKGIAKRRATQLKKFRDAKKPEAKATPEKKEEKKGFDYAEKAYLKSSGLAPTEFSLVEDIMKNTGKSLDDVLESKYFQAELKEMRDNKASKDAIPNGSKRSTSSARDSVEYWIAKGELPPTDQIDLRRKVVNTRMKAEKDRSVFASKSVV